MEKAFDRVAYFLLSGICFFIGWHIQKVGAAPWQITGIGFILIVGGAFLLANALDFTTVGELWQWIKRRGKR